MRPQLFNVHFALQERVCHSVMFVSPFYTNMHTETRKKGIVAHGDTTKMRKSVIMHGVDDIDFLYN